MKNAIGIVGGVGPFAGLDLAKKVLNHTKSTCDQDYIDTYIVSLPSIIKDRTGYLLNGGENPAVGINVCVEKLKKCDANVVGIACNTAHSKRILDEVNFPKDMQFINMIEKTVEFISKNFPSSKTGLLSTLGTLKTGVYSQYFESAKNLCLVTLNDDFAKKVNDAIYDEKYGIKVIGANQKAKDIVLDAIKELKKSGISNVILGCTELPLLFENENKALDVSLVDPSDILASELVKAADLTKFK